MGLNIATLQFIEQHVDVSSKRICIYGNLYLKRGTDEIQIKLGSKLASTYFMHCGASEITMLDINKKDGALPIDLDKPIDNIDLLESFDVLIDGGTSEHVKNQYSCFWNAFNLCKPGALMLHMIPAKGHWINHGRWGYPLHFFKELARYSGYTIIEMYQDNYVSKLVEKKHDLVFTCLKKELHSVFVSQKIFEEKLLPILEVRSRYAKKK
jgi:hypothetical protein